MTKAADTGGTVPTASVVASGAQRESLIPYRSAITQALIDIGAILAGLVLLSVFAVAIAVAVFAFLFVKF